MDNSEVFPHEEFESFGPEDFVFLCDACGNPCEMPYFEEGDRVECELCNIRCDAVEYFQCNGVDINFFWWHPDAITALVIASVERHLRKG